MNDYISRQAAIIQLSHNKSRGDDEWMLAVESDMGVIQAIPAADVTPVVHGYWIVHENADVFEGYEVPMFECSKCRAWKEDDSDFCPDCGADMRGEQDDSV